MRSGRRRATTAFMIEVGRFLFWSIAGLFRRRVELVAENALFRQQLIVAQHKPTAREDGKPPCAAHHAASRLDPDYRTAHAMTVTSCGRRLSSAWTQPGVPWLG